MNNSAPENITTSLPLDDPGLLAMLIHRFSTLLYQQQNELLEARNMRLSSRSISTLMLLRRKGSSSVSQIARELSISHQLAAQRLKSLKKRRLIEEGEVGEDRRKTILQLTSRGHKLANEIEELWRDVERAYQDLFQEIGTDLTELLNDACHTLIRSPLSERIRMSQSLLGQFD